MIHTAPWGAVAVAALVCFVTGGIWYSPPLFGTRMLSEVGIDPSSANRASGALLAIPQSLLAAFGLGVILASASVTSLNPALGIAAIVWVTLLVGFELPAIAVEGKARLFAMRSGHHLVALLGMAVVFGLWR